MKILFITIIMVFSFSTVAQDKYCKDYKPSTWEQMKEREFTKEKLEKRIALIEKQMKKDMPPAEEFTKQSEIIIKGGLLRNSVELTKNSKYTASHKYYVKQYCDFLKNEAHIVH